MTTYLKLIILFLFLNFLGAVKFRCDYEYIPGMKPVGWYKYHIIPATFDNARLRCQYEGGVLWSPTTTSKNFPANLPIFKRKTLTGIHAIFSKGSFHSIEGVPFDTKHIEWGENEPDNKNNSEDCIAMDAEELFYDVNCNDPLPFVCFRRQSTIESTVCGTPDREYNYALSTNKCYKFHNEVLTFRQAHFACHSEGGHLAIINSIEESRVISEMFKKKWRNIVPFVWHGGAFIGFTNWFHGSDWRTIFGQTLEEAGFSNWYPGEPNNSSTGEYCGGLYQNGLLDDMLCENSYAFICEKSIQSPLVCETVFPNTEDLEARAGSRVDSRADNRTGSRAGGKRKSL